MTFLLCLACGVFVWGLMLRWARQQINAASAEAEVETEHWHRQAIAAHRQLARVIRDVSLREEARRQGRDDVIAMFPLIDTARSCRHDAADNEEGAA